MLKWWQLAASQWLGSLLELLIFTFFCAKLGMEQVGEEVNIIM